MPKNECLDCGSTFEVTSQEKPWRTYCNDCYKIRMTLKEQGLSKEEVEEIRQKSKSKIYVTQPPKPKKVESSQVEVIQPAKEEKHIETKENFEAFIDKKGMEFKEISVSLGEKVSVDYQSRNAQIGAVVSIGNVSIELAYQSALNFVKDRLKEQVKRIREEML